MSRNKVLLKGDGHQIEGLASAVIQPGMQIELGTDGKYAPVAGVTADVLKGGSGFKVALEDRLQGKTMADSYAIGDVVFIYQAVPGDEMNLLVKSGEDIAIADKINPEGATGLFTEAAGGDARVVAEALEAVGVLAADTHVACRITSV